VSGLLALIRASHPGLSAGNVINRLTATATKAGDSIVYGSGLINAAAAVTASVPSVKNDPAKDLAEWIRLNRRAASTATPVPTPTPTPSATPTPVVSAQGPFGKVLPSIAALRDTGVPLLVYAIFAILFAILVRGAWREFGSTRRK
jgi:hypothetical protein